MFAHKKIIKEKGAEPEPFEVDVAQAICDLEANSNDLKAELRELYIVSAKEVDVSGRKAVVIFVPFKLLKIVHKIQSRLVREVRTRFSPNPMAHAPRALLRPPPLPVEGTPSRCCLFGRLSPPPPPLRTPPSAGGVLCRGGTRGGRCRTQQPGAVPGARDVI